MRLYEAIRAFLTEGIDHKDIADQLHDAAREHDDKRFDQLYDKVSKMRARDVQEIARDFTASSVTGKKKSLELIRGGQADVKRTLAVQKRAGKATPW